MNVRLPYAKSKRYLTGIDWVVGALGQMTYRATGGSNTSQIVLALNGAFDDERFRKAVSEFTRQFPVLVGRPARCWNLAPYWKMSRPGTPVPVRVDTTSVDEASLQAALEGCANAWFNGANEHLAFRVFHVGAKSHCVTMHFSHEVFDAQGAESFLGLFQRWYQGEDCRDSIAQIALTEPAHLCDWQQKFEAGKQLGRMVRGFPKTPPLVVPRPSPLRGRMSRFWVMEFDEQESKAIHDRASREAGFLMFMPYALTAGVQAFDAALRARGGKGQDYIISVSVDARTRETAAQRLFFNNLSFLFFHVPEASVGDRQNLLAAIRTQMYEQVKSGFPRALSESSMLMRILPRSVLARLLLWLMNGEPASFAFSSVNKRGYPASRFMDADVANLFHMPLVPVPPGIGLFVNEFGSLMNVVLSYLDGMLSSEDVSRFDADLRRLL